MNPDILRHRIKTALDEYRLQHTLELGTEDGLALVDALTPPYSPTIALGTEELNLLTDHIANFLEEE